MEYIYYIFGNIAIGKNCGAKDWIGVELRKFAP
jgi:hypothetical protein